MLRAARARCDGVVLGDDAYGGTFRLIARLWGAPELGSGAVAWRAADLTDPDALAAEWPEGTRAGVVGDAHQPAADVRRHRRRRRGGPRPRRPGGRRQHVRHARTCSSPLALGADIVVHSATKYLGGHSDVVGGFVAVDDDDLAERSRFVQNAAGAVPAPFDCYLVLRGVKTLAVRMDRHCANARAVVELLADHPRRRAGALPGARRPPRPRRRGAADVRLRRDGELHGARRRGRGAAGGRRHRAVHARRVARRGREPDRAPGGDDPRVGRRTRRSRSPTTSCGSPSASKPRSTWSPTSNRRSTRSDRARAAIWSPTFSISRTSVTRSTNETESDQIAALPRERDDRSVDHEARPAVVVDERGAVGVDGDELAVVTEQHR